MTAVASPPVVELPEREAPCQAREHRQAERTVPLCQTTTLSDAEHQRLLLILYEIHCAIVQRDALTGALVLADILILAADHARAAAIIKEHRAGDADAEWGCFNCGETVPGNFDVCWNCCESRTGDVQPWP